MGKNIAIKKEDGRKNNYANFGDKASPGRPRGSKNLLSKGIKDDMLTVYNRLGDADGLYKWCKKNPSNLSLFYRMMISLLPKDIHIDQTVTHSLSKLSDEDLMIIIKRGSLLTQEAIDISSSNKEGSWNEAEAGEDPKVDS